MHVRTSFSAADEVGGIICYHVPPATSFPFLVHDIIHTYVRYVTRYRIRVIAGGMYIAYIAGLGSPRPKIGVLGCHSSNVKGFFAVGCHFL